MIFTQEKLAELTKEMMRTKNNSLRNVVNDIKTSLKYWSVSNPGKTLSDSDELTIVKKVADQRKQTIETANGREDIIKDAQAELDILNEYLPAEITPEQIETAVKNMIADGMAPEKKNMGLFMKTLKGNFPTADGKMISSVVSKHLS